MMKNKTTNIERLIAKIDNDFNPDNSDWVPRVGAWATDAMNILDVLRTTKTKKQYDVKNNIVYVPCGIDKDNIKVYDDRGCEIISIDEVRTNCCNPPSTGQGASETSTSITPDTIGVINSNINNHNRNYVIIDNNKLEISYNTKFVTIEQEEVETCKSQIYGCELPMLPDNGLLLEAIAYYCMYKMLCRGYKHPVFNLGASQYGTNPYYQWTILKEEARRAIINNNIDDDASRLFRSNFFINTFDSRN